MTKLNTKRFVIRKSLIGTNTIITFENKKDLINLKNQLSDTQGINKISTDLT